MLSSFFLAAQTPNYNTCDGHFSYQKDVEGNLSHEGTKKMATIHFDGKTLNFVNYCLDDSKTSMIILRQINNSGDLKPDFDNPDPDYKFGDITNLKNLGKFNWQPAPVEYKGKLFLFVGNSTNGISFSSLSTGDKVNKNWTALTEVKISGNAIANFEGGMAAITMDTELCVVFRNKSTGFLNMLHTADPLAGWEVDEFPIYIAMAGSDISAITTSGVSNRKKCSILTLAYIDAYNHVLSASLKRDNTGNFEILYSGRVISSENEYSSVALIEGAVKGDAESTGRCIQAFLKKKVVDNNLSGMHRILQFQLKQNETVWEKRANNLVPQTSPKHLWACKNVNLTTAIVPMTEGGTIHQFMCLFYMGYDTDDYPLNCAYQQTDEITYTTSLDLKIVNCLLSADSLIKNRQFIGYVEGPPPFYKNHVTDPTSAVSDKDLSGVTYSVSNTNAGSTTHEINVSAHANVSIGPFKAGVSAEYDKITENAFSKTVISVQNFDAFSKPTYITLIPKIVFYPYVIFGINDKKPIDTTYYGQMGQPQLDYIEAEFTDGLNPSDPVTYINCAHDNYDAWKEADGYSFGKISNTWIPSGQKEVKLEIKEGESAKNTAKASVSVSLDFLFFNAGVDASIEYEMSTVSENGTEIHPSINLNLPTEDTDVKKLSYDTYWLKPNFTQPFATNNPNWWLHPEAPNQNTWCVAYRVTKLELKNGSIILNPGPGNGSEAETETASALDPKTNSAQTSNVSNGDFYLYQNYPNPVNKSTFIKYQVGSNESIIDPNSSSQGTQTKLTVFDLRGIQVATLVDELKQPGQYQVEWDATQIMPGLYFYRIQSGSFRDVKKMVLLK
jgi:hypothetical protein